MTRGQSLGRVTTAGSQRYLQDLVNDNPGYLNRLIFQSSPDLVEYARVDPKWVSPLTEENYKEYSDDEFLWPINQAPLYKKLQQFWPRGGPQWDALAVVEGKTSINGVILAEAKANIRELGSPAYACRATGRSREKIEHTLAIVREALGTKPEADWMGDYYQYANRLAHLYFLNTLCGVPTWMVFIYFLSDEKLFHMHAAEEWYDSLAYVQTTLGLPKEHKLAHRIVNIFPRVYK